MLELKVLVPDDSLADSVVAFVLFRTSLDLSEAVVDKFVHEAVQHGVRSGLVDPVVAVVVEVVLFDRRILGSYRQFVRDCCTYLRCG